MAAAELALAAGFPGDARAFLAEAPAEGGAAERRKRLADMAARQSAADVQALGAFAREAAAAADGRAWEKLGQAYASYGRHDEAVAAFDKALAKGGLDHPEDAQLHLGIACLNAGQTARARQVLAGITAEGGAAELARLWLLRGAS
jgi:tetratricopeptide (TPR) repeat protein